MDLRRNNTHPLLTIEFIALCNPQPKLLNYSKSKKIVARAFSPFGQPTTPLLTDESAIEIGGLKSISSLVTDVCSRLLFVLWWPTGLSAVIKDLVIFPESMSPAHIESNRVLDGVDKQMRWYIPPWAIAGEQCLNVLFGCWHRFRRLAQSCKQYRMKDHHEIILLVQCCGWTVSETWDLRMLWYSKVNLVCHETILLFYTGPSITL